MSNDTPTLEQQAAQAREHQLRFVVNVLVRRWRMITGITVAFMLLYGTYGLMRQQKERGAYQAHAKVVVTQSIWDKGILKSVGVEPLIALDAKSLVDRTKETPLAENLLKALIQQDIADGKALSRIVTEDERKAKIQQIINCLDYNVEDQNSGVIRITIANAPSQEEAARMAEYAARVFVEQHRQAQLEKERETHEVVRKRLEELQQQLYTAETEEWEFRKAMGFQTYGETGKKMAELNDELAKAKAKKEATLARLAKIAAELKQNQATLPESLAVVSESVVNGMLTDLNKLLKEKLKLSVIYQPSFEGLIELDDEIKEQGDAILLAIQQLDQTSAGGSSAWSIRQNLYRDQLKLQLDLTDIDITIDATQKTLEELIPQIPELANMNLEYERLTKNAGYIRQQFNQLREKEFDIRTALGRDGATVARHEAVTASMIPMGHGTRASMNFIIAGLVGFIAAFGLSIMLEIMDTSIRSIEDVNAVLGLEVIGTIPEMKFGKARGGRRRSSHVASPNDNEIDACIVTQCDPKSPISEAYRALRTNFQFATIRQKPKTVMITSAVPGEGKTTTAVNMAVTIADLGVRVLLVDTDLRRPNVHRVLRMERGPGLADVLRGENELKDVIRSTRVQNLSVISSGRVPPNPSELIGSAKMQRIMAQLGANFDLVICDAPSVLVVTDPVLLATYVDTVMVVVSVNNARRETVQRAQKILQTANAHVAGVVLNGLEATRRHYYYYYYYYEDGGRTRRPWYHL